MGHLHNVTTITTTNPTAAGIANASVMQHQSKAFNMHFYWVCDCVSQGQVTVIWKKGKQN
jgi:hypothetical protein